MIKHFYLEIKKIVTFLLAILLSQISFSQNLITWSDEMDVATSSYDNLFPRIVVDGSGIPMVIWSKASDKSVFFSRCDDSLFSTPVKLNPSWLEVSGASWYGSDIASKGDTVYVVMKKTPETIDTNHIYITRSFDAGTTFSSPTRVDFIADSISRFPIVTIDALGSPIVAFMKFNSSNSDERWAVTKSSDYGDNFSTDVKASGQSGGVVCECCPGGIVNSNNTTAVLYRANNSNLRDIWAGVSSDNCTSFPNGYNIDQNNWLLNSCPSTGPDGIIIDDTLYSVFMNGASGTSRVHLSKFNINGDTVNTVSLLTNSISGLSSQNYPRIDHFGSAAAVVWKQTISGKSQLSILFTNNIANGFPESYDTVRLNYITNTDVAISNGNVYVVWQDDNSGTVKFRKGTFTPVNSSINKIQENRFSIYPNPVTSELNIQLSVNKIFEIEIINSLGNTIIKTKNVNNIDVSALSNGIYFIMLKNKDDLFIQRFIKQ